LNKIETTAPGGSRFLWAIALVFVCLGAGYSLLTPAFENSDETLHYPFVKHLADGQGLPLAIPDQLWGQEGTQPPLYYAVVAASTFWLDSDNLPDLLQRNPHWLFTEVRATLNDNQNLVLHGPFDAFPFRRAALAVQIGRAWSLFFGLLTVVLTFLLARHLFPAHLPIAVTATALTAFTPQFIRVSATVSNDSLSAALTTLAVLLALKFTAPKPHRSDFWPPLMLGLVAGLAVLTKLSSLSTLALVGFIVFWRQFFLGEGHQSPQQKLWRWLMVIAVAVIMLTGWWFWRNYQLYGEWFATETHLNLAGRGFITPAQVWNLRAEAERAYWATFGWGQIRPPEWVYQLLFGFSRIGLLGLLVGVLAPAILPRQKYPLSHINIEHIVILVLWAGLNFVLYLRWVMEVGSVSHTRLVFPAITAISLLLALGWHSLLPPKLHGWFSGAVVAALITFNIYSLGGLIVPAFTPPTADASAQMTPLDITFPDKLTLVGGGVSGPAQTVAGNIVTIHTDWRVLESMSQNYSVSAVLLAPDGSVLAHRETYPSLGLRPTRYLSPGQTFTDNYPLRLEIDVDQPMIARAVVGLFDFESETRAGFPAFDAAENTVTPVVGRVKIVPSTWPVYQPAAATEVDFGEIIALTGYDFDAQSTELTLYWQALASPGRDYTLFIHLLDKSGAVVAQADAPPAHNAYPTGWWAAGETIAGTHRLPLTVDTVAVRLGLYDPATGARLPIGASTLPVQDNSAEIPISE
jgi:hypothetical protein